MYSNNEIVLFIIILCSLLIIIYICKILYKYYPFKSRKSNNCTHTNTGNTCNTFNTYNTSDTCNTCNTCNSVDAFFQEPPSFSYIIPAVSVFTGPNYTGTQSKCEPGNYGVFGRSMGVPNNSIMSIIVPNGMTITLYTDNNHSSVIFKTFTNNVADLGPSWNKSVSSFIITSASPCTDLSGAYKFASPSSSSKKFTIISSTEDQCSGTIIFNSTVYLYRIVDGQVIVPGWPSVTGVITTSGKSKTISWTDDTTWEMIHPFVAGQMNSTDWQSGTGGNNGGYFDGIYLDRANIDCNGQGINSFQYIRDGDNFRYNYKCVTGGSMDPVSAANTKKWPFSDQSMPLLPSQPGPGTNRSINYLVGLNTSCPVGNVLTSLKLINDYTDTQVYHWKMAKTCSASLATSQGNSSDLSCRQLFTPENSDGGGNTIFLDRHNITCDSDEAISQVQLINPSLGNISYQYTCCKFPTTDGAGANSPAPYKTGMRIQLPEKAVTLYTDINFQGDKTSRIPGFFDVPQMGVPNDSISSIKVPDGMWIKVFQHNNRGGASAVFTSDMADLRNAYLSGSSGASWNDVISSFDIGTGSPPAVSALLEKAVTLYADINFQGDKVSQIPGFFDLPQMGLPNDSISSIKVPDGMWIKVYQHNNRGGASAVFTSDMADLRNAYLSGSSGASWNDEITSFDIGIGSPPAVPLPEGTYQKSCSSCNYDGNFLSCDCATRDNRKSSSALKVGSCNGRRIENINGALMC